MERKDFMNYNDMSRQYSAEAERLQGRINILRKRKPGSYWQIVEMNRALELMDSMYLDCLVISRYLKGRGVDPNAQM